MYLKGLEMHGFKSFADKTLLEFKPGITTVIGPNGSGKSNISDSIRWVLGEQSMKSLRGAKLEDIIFAGTQNRKSLGFAEVSILIDNSDGKLPIEYSEVRVTRKIYRSGETGYFINKVPCRLKDILELFMDTGIGKDGYSIISQGKIDEILSNKSEDRRHIFEEAAGIVKYRTRKMEAEKKIEQTKLNLLRVNDILIEIEASLEPLKVQSDKARKFLDLREELKNVEVGLFAYNIESYKEKLNKILEDENILKNQNEEENKKIERFQANREELKIILDKITEEIEGVQNLGFESSNKIEKVNSEIAVSNERIVNNKENKSSYEKEIEELNDKIKRAEDDKNLKKEKKNNYSLNKEKYEKELKEKEEELKKITEKLSGKELEIEQDKKDIEEYSERRYDLASEIATEKTNLENNEKRKKIVKQNIQSIVLELDKLRQNKQDMSNLFYEIECERNKIEKDLEQARLQKQEKVTKIGNYESEINNLLDESRMKESRYKFLVETEKEKEGYINSVKSLLLECEKNLDLQKGMNGVLANLISTDKKYEVAIEMCLGSVLQNIVTDTEEDAKKLVEYLRNNNLGRASFLPISSVKGKKLDKINDKGIDGVIGIASDLILCDKKYRQIVESLLGRTVVVENMDQAIALSKKNGYSYKVITLKGDIINPSGAISGGSVKLKTLSILGREKEIAGLKEELQDLKKKIEKVTQQKEDYENSILAVLQNVENLEKKLQETDIVYATEKQKIFAVETEIEKIENKLNKEKDEIVTIDGNITSLIESMEEKEQERSQLEEKMETLRVSVEQFAEMNKDNQKFIDDLNYDITNLKISVSSFDDSENSIDEILAIIDQDIESSNTSIQNKKEQIRSIDAENQILLNNINDLNKQIETIKREVENSSSKIEELRQRRTDESLKLKELEENIDEQYKVIEDIKENLIKIDLKKTKTQQDIEDSVNYLWNEYELTPNNIGEYRKPNNIQEASKTVNKLKNQIRDLGSINVDSIEEYRKNKERYDFMCEQRLDLENTAAKLRDIIKNMTDVMKKQFSEKFKEINKNFNEVFTELFGGGRASLILQDEDNILECGIDIHVQPPGKKLQNMMLLSGGEKAFTAIALLFAILKINPAPFCVLDEIEAALDDVNVYRFAEYLKKFSRDTQFLVITHRKGTMESADTVYGVTMEENGISKLLSMKLN